MVQAVHGFMSNLIKKSWTDSTTHMKLACYAVLVHSHSESVQWSDCYVTEVFCLFYTHALAQCVRERAYRDVMEPR